MTNKHDTMSPPPPPTAAKSSHAEAAGTGVSRRTLVAGAAWAVPAVSAVTALPTMAASDDPSPRAYSSWGVVRTVFRNDAHTRATITINQTESSGLGYHGVLVPHSNPGDQLRNLRNVYWFSDPGITFTHTTGSSTNWSVLTRTDQYGTITATDGTKYYAYETVYLDGGTVTVDAVDQRGVYHLSDDYYFSSGDQGVHLPSDPCSGRDIGHAYYAEIRKTGDPEWAPLVDDLGVATQANTFQGQYGSSGELVPAPGWWNNAWRSTSSPQRTRVPRPSYCSGGDVFVPTGSSPRTSSRQGGSSVRSAAVGSAHSGVTSTATQPTSESAIV